MSEIKMITYEVGGLKLTQDILSMKESKQAFKIINDLDWGGISTGGTKGVALTRELMETDRFEKLLEVCIKGIPEGEKVCDVVSLDQAFDMVSDFFEFNANLILVAMTLSVNSTPINQESEKKSQKSKSTVSKSRQPIKPEGQDSMKESSTPSPKVKPGE